MQSVSLPFTRQFIQPGDPPSQLPTLARKPLSRPARRLHLGEYRQLVRDIRKVAKAAIPAGATVAVISKGDHQLLDLGARAAWHFPQLINGGYTGHHPADSAEAIAKLEEARAGGAEFLLVPATAFWWLEFYEDFARHLTSCYRVVTDQPATCLIYQLTDRARSPSWLARAKIRFLLPLTRAVGAASTAIRDGAACSSFNAEFRVALDSQVPRKLVVGEGAAIYVSGWCYHQAAELASLELLANGPAEPVKIWRIPRPDVYAAHYPHSDPRGLSYHSGFAGWICFSKINDPIEVPLVLRAKLRNGAVIVRELTRVVLEPGHRAPAHQTVNGAQPLVAICMTTFNPPLDLFERQIESIRNQSFRNWNCIISDDGSRPDIFEKARRIIGDDPRFKIHRTQSGLGFYGNFERCLSFTPEEADFVALADQDDYWHPDKLEALLATFDSKTSLVYSDMRIVDQNGDEIAASYWTTRPNNYTRFDSLLMANCITGAASMFRRSLLQFVLPFPQRIGEAYHDHWIGAVALAAGKIKYVNRPLYDYVQHSANVIGHHAPAVSAPFFPLGFNWRRPWHSLQKALNCWEPIYFFDLLRIQLISRLLLLRCAPLMTAEKAAEAGRIDALGESCRSLIWLAARAIGRPGRISETVGAERRLLGAILWKFCAQSPFWWSVSGLRKTRIAAAPSARAASNHSRSRYEFIQEKIAPLSLTPSAAAPRRVNLLIPTIDLNYFFGGYITKFNLARRLAAEGLRVRMVIVDGCDWQPARWREQFQKFAGLESFFDQVEVVCAHDRSTGLEVSPQDAFIATTWWTAHIAHHAVKTLGGSRFVYLIQEYEPFTFPMGTFAALAGQSYEFPHYAIFSTELLRGYFRKNGLGVFADSASAGAANSVSFQNAITDVGRIKQEDLARRPSRRLLFYARPEAHAERNMFDFGVLALSEAIKDGYFDQRWEFYGIGSLSSASQLPLGQGCTLTLLPRENQETYRDILRSHDLGLALMFTPHPSLVPIEMASAGMVVVTNTCENKTRQALSAISTNIIAVHPSLEAIKGGLLQAAAQVDDVAARVRGARVNWATDWQSAFNPNVMQKIRGFVAASRCAPAARKAGKYNRESKINGHSLPAKINGLKKDHLAEVLSASAHPRATTSDRKGAPA